MAQAHNLVWNETNRKWREAQGDPTGIPFVKPIDSSDTGEVLTTTALGANGVYTQDAQDRLLGQFPVGRVGGLAFADKAGTLVVEECETADFASPTTLSTISVAANTTTAVPWVSVSKRYYRFKYTNGAVAQTGFVLIQQVGGLGVDVVELNGSILQQDPETGVKTVTATAAEVFAGLTALSGRDKLIVYNEGSNNVYWGKGTVTPTNGFPLLPGDSIVFSLDSNQNIPIYFVAESDTVVRVGEMA